MSTPQTTILPEGAQACIVIEADLIAGTETRLREACADILEITARRAHEDPESQLGVAIGFGSALWQRLNHPNEGVEIKDFTPVGNAPATQHDLAIHVQSLHHRANLPAAIEILERLGGIVHVCDEIHGFRQYAHRGFDGFVDGTENPTGTARAAFGVISDEQADAGGSYLLLQRYVHDLKHWDELKTVQQEAAVGRTKASDEELDGSVRLPESHLGRVDIKEDGVGLKIVRQSLPYGTASGERGLMFIAYCARLYNIDQQIQSMFGARDGKTDLLLQHLSTPVSGAYYFVPSQERLADL